MEQRKLVKRTSQAGSKNCSRRSLCHSTSLMGGEGYMSVCLLSPRWCRGPGQEETKQSGRKGDTENHHSSGLQRKPEVAQPLQLSQMQFPTQHAVHAWLVWQQPCSSKHWVNPLLTISLCPRLLTFWKAVSSEESFLQELPLAETNLGTTCKTETSLRWYRTSGIPPPRKHACLSHCFASRRINKNRAFKTQL